MNYKTKIQVIEKLVRSGEIFTAEVTCNDWGIDTSIIRQLAEGKEMKFLKEKKNGRFYRKYNLFDFINEHIVFILGLIDVLLFFGILYLI